MSINVQRIKAMEMNSIVLTTTKNTTQCWPN